MYEVGHSNTRAATFGEVAAMGFIPFAGGWR
uniref:Uncharacterized protein n=1 Tax=Anguilla anguilla TaxID=7936 RepID=A0A0E9VJ05_ANGAN